MDKKSFTVLVRSWKDKAHMNRAGAESAGSDPSTISSGNKSGALSVKSFQKSSNSTSTFLKPGEKSSMWTLRITMETEQACTLAVTHIENKRKDIHSKKMARLRSILDKWASDTDFISPHE